ncbi:MAG: hypothetical protein K2K44_05275, partial [Oscillospiraceae bacterium]|nr:hypothetical protein [Oscillospiraceae bacterium]
MENNISQAVEKIFRDCPVRLVFNKPPKDGGFRKINMLKKQNIFQAEKYTEKQVFHDNLPDENSARDYCIS